MEDCTPLPQPETPPPLSSAVDTRPRVLVVDDDWDICDAVKVVLDDAGFDTVCAENGARALAHLAQAPAPDAILLDLFMPVMDGWTFAERMRADPDLRDIPLIVMTASGPHWGYPSSPVLRKPIFHHELVRVVKKACSS
jgi:CheY-like chemotaxis protein